MADLALRILKPEHNAWLDQSGDVELQGEVVSGSAEGLYFKWYSTLNTKATEAQPELNLDHSAAALNFTTPLDVGSHVITLAAADNPALEKGTRAAFAGGAPSPTNQFPCVVHRLAAELKTPANNADVSKSSATLEVRAPCRWAMETEKGSEVYVNDPDYHAVNRVQFRFRFEPDGAPNAAKTADLTPAVDAFTFFLEGDDDNKKPYLRWQGALPANLGTGAYKLTLFVESDNPQVSAKASVTRKVNLTG